MNFFQKKFLAGFCAALFLACAVRAETVVWSDNFEGNVPGRWMTTNTTWKIGSPPNGPAKNTNGFRVHSATNCAFTSNYSYNQDARLVCTNYSGATNFLVPATNQFPRLRFWHWFDFANAFGYVEIKSGTNDWQQISPIYHDIASGGVWSRPAIDLTAFAGQRVQIAFHFDSFGCCGNAQGWFVDDVAIVTGAPVFDGGFEHAPSDWSVADGTWEIGSPSSGPNSARTGTNCAATILAGNYANNVDSRLISPRFTVPVATNATLNFWHWYNFNNALGFVEISTNLGNDWNQISPTYSNGSLTGWTNVSLNLNAYAGQTVQVAFRFGSFGIYNAPGWYVDDVTFNGTPIASPQLILPSSTRTNFQFSFSTIANTSWRIDASTNLADWLPVFTNAAGTNGNFQFSDPAFTNFSRRFYRAAFQSTQ